ncbi:hypothetical protein Tco_0304680 [Tanacetum coccineum]
MSTLILHHVLKFKFLQSVLQNLLFQPVHLPQLQYKDAPSKSTSQTTPKTPSPVIALSVEEADHDIEVAHMDNSPYDDFPIPEPSFKESSNSSSNPMGNVLQEESGFLYGAILPEAITNQALLDSVAYKTYHKITSGAEPLKSRKSQKKSDSAISSEESPSKKKPAKNPATKPKQTKKKAHVKADKGTDEGISTKPGVPNVPKYDSESEKESWGDSGEEDDDDKDDYKDVTDDGYDNDDDDDEKNDDEEETDSDRTKSDIIKIPVLSQSTTEYHEEEDEKVDDEENMDEEEDGKVTKELYKDVNVNLGNRDADMTDADQVLDTQKTDELVQSSSISSDFTSKLLNLENPSLADNVIASLMDITIHHEEPRSQTSSLYTVLVTVVPEITSVFTTTIPPPPPFFNPLPQQATPTLTPTVSETITSFSALPDFVSVFKFNERVTNLENDLSEMKQEYNLDFKQEAQDEKREYIELVDTSIRTILKEVVNTQLLQILPQAVSDFATLVIEKNITESLEAAVLARSSSQPKSTYEAAASLSRV